VANHLSAAEIKLRFCVESRSTKKGSRHFLLLIRLECFPEKSETIAERVLTSRQLQNLHSTHEGYLRVGQALLSAIIF
jgi:hypothetical protein